MIVIKERFHVHNYIFCKSVIEHITVELQWLNTLLKDAIAGRLSEVAIDED